MLRRFREMLIPVSPVALAVTLLPVLIYPAVPQRAGHAQFS